METKGYVVDKVTGADSEETHDVIITTEHPLSSYGQPVIIDNGEAIPAQNYGYQIARYRDSDVTLIDKANRLSGHPSEYAAADKQMADGIKDMGWFR